MSTIPNICSFLRPFLDLTDHGLLFKVMLFLYTASFVAAQQGTLSSPAPPATTDPFYNSQPKFNPSLAVLMIIIVSAFFLMGFFSVYVRRCAEGRYRGSNFNPSATPIGGGARWSRRVNQGLDAAVIETFPTFLYSTVKGHKIGKDSLECAVCLNEFEDDQTLRLIPKCNHVFHPDCIDAWLASHTTCPVCRANLVPKPGDLVFDSTLLFEPNNNNSSNQRSNSASDQTQNDDVLIHVSDDNNDQNREVPQPESQNVILLNTANQNRPPRSRSTGWRFGKLFPRSHSTGHSLVQPGENLDRFTLRLPEEVRSQLMNTHLNRTKSCVTFTRAMSSRTGYRRSGSSRNYLTYERFDREGRADRWGFTMTPPFIARTGSVRSLKGATGGNDEVNANPQKNFLKSVKSPIDRLFIGGDNSGNNNVGERSSDRLRGADVLC